MILSDVGLWIGEGARMVRRRWRVHKDGWIRYSGSPRDICLSAVKDCWNGRYFQTSAGHFCGFYIRDFAWVIKPLLALGFEQEVNETLRFALDAYKRGRLKTTLTPSGRCIDVFAFSPDTLAYLLYAISASDFELLSSDRKWIEREIARFTERVFDERTKLVRSDVFFGSMKDHAKRRSSSYDNVMLALVAREARSLGFSTMFKERPVVERLLRRSWNGSFIADDAQSTQRFSADSAIIGFWCGILDDEKKFNSTVSVIERKMIQDPVGLAYDDAPATRYNFAHWFAKDYETTSRWMHLGVLYLDCLKMFSHPSFETELKKMTRYILRDQNMLEVYTPTGVPYQNSLYFSDEGMIWAAGVAGLLERGD